jgi:hypothetical protein
MSDPNLSGEFDPTPPPGIVQKQKRDFTLIAAEVGELLKQKDETEFEIGDRMVEAETGYGKDSVKEVARVNNLTWTTARQYHWMARKFPKGHKLRNMVQAGEINYSILRAVQNTEKPEDWAEKARDNGWSVQKLIEEMGSAATKKAQEDGRPCIHCNDPLPNAGEVVAIHITGRGRAWCCNIKHAALYLSELSEADAGVEVEEEDLDPFVHSG